MSALKHRMLDGIRSGRKPVVLREFENTRFTGLYAIWYRHRCLYVGKADRQTVHDRLWQHLSEAHNRELRRWINVKDGDLRFTTFELDASAFKEAGISDPIGAAEAFLIHELGPETNKQKPGEERWLALFPPCAEN